jgi:hypothetical protein
MKKTDCLSYGIAVLLTVAFFGIFFMGADGIAQINNAVCQDYQCTGTAYEYGEVVDSGASCVEFCDYGFEVYATDYDLFEAWLYPATGSKNLLGTCDTYSIGCSVESRGRSIIANITYIEEGLGYVEILKCTPCDSCCG